MKNPLLGLIVWVLLTSFILPSAIVPNVSEKQRDTTSECFYQKHGVRPPGIEWNKTYGGPGTDFFYCGCQTNDGGYIASGNREIEGKNYAWILKLDKNGVQEWEVTAMENETYMAFTSYVKQTDDGGYIACGSLTEGTTHHRYHRFIWKLDASGKTEWINCYDTPEQGHFYMMQETTNGGYVAVGYVYTNEQRQDTNVLMLKTDIHGNVEWRKTFRYSDGADEGYCLTVANDGGFVIGGWAQCSQENYDFWIIKTDECGHEQWNKTFGGTELDICHARNCYQTADGGYLFGGHTFSYGAGSGDIWNIHVDSAGNMQWNETFGYPGSKELIWAMEKTNDGFILAGVKNCDDIIAPRDEALVIKIDSDGNAWWTMTVGGPREDQAAYVNKTLDGGYIVIGRTKSFGRGDWDGWLLKIGPDKSTERPSLRLTKPRPGRLYLFDMLTLPVPFLDEALVVNDLTFTSRVEYDADDSYIVKVEYFINGRVVGRATEANYPFTWSGAKSGLYRVKARAYTGWGATDRDMVMIKKIW